MVFDAQALWWPPFQKLYTQLETLKLEPSAVPADALKATLADYEPWLARGVAGFLPPSEASRKALEGEASLSIGAKKLPVEAGLRAAAADISRTLNLDEVQAYILLRRWVAKAGPQALLPATAVSGASSSAIVLAGSAAGAASGGGSASLSPDQRLEVVQLYYAERLFLLKSIESLLWQGERAGGGPLLDVIEGTLSSLLAANLEDTTFQVLQANLEAAAQTKALATTASRSLSLAPLTFAPYGSTGVGTGGGAGALAAANAEPQAHAVAVERCSLLYILILIYYHPRKQCTPDRFLSLAKLFHSSLFTRVPLLHTASSGPSAAGSGELSPAQLSVKLATLLLLEMLDVDKALAALASQQPIDKAAYVFAAPAVKERVNAELASWWPTAATAHSPVLLAWAAVLCLMARTGADGGQDGISAADGSQEYAVHAAKAYETDALGTLCQLTTHVGLQPDAAEMCNNIVLSTLSAAFCAFNFSPVALPLPQAEQVVGIMANLFRGQSSLCESFWAGDRNTDEPLRHFLDDLRSLYPALPTPLYTMLAALSSTADSAASANAYLAQLSGLVCLHVLPDTAIEERCNEEGDVYTRQALPLPGARALTLPQGILGKVLPLPEGFTSTDALWTVPAGEDVDHVSLVRWRMPLPEGVGQWILLARLSEALALVQRQPPGFAAHSAESAHAAAALAEMAAAFQLLSTLCTRDPHTAIELLHVELPGGAVDSGQRGPDLLSMACQAAAVLAQLPDPPTTVIADCLAVCAALAEGIPGRVAAELLSLCGISPALSAAAASATPDAMLGGQEVDVPLLRVLLPAEGAKGRYPAIQAFLRLLTVLVSAASPTAALQVLVVWVLHRVLAEHRRWRYAVRAERWRLAGLSLRLVRLSLLSAPTTPRPAPPLPAAAATGGAQGKSVHTAEGSAIAAAVAAVLGYDVGMAACLLTALPHHAEQLERIGAEARSQDEVTAVEDCCIEWHRLIPVLLPASNPEARLAPAAFFKPCQAAAALAWPQGSGTPQAAASAAAVLLSYISYPYFGSAERALVMRSMHCLAAVAAEATPGAVFAVLLPQGSPEAGVASAARGAIAAAFSPQAAATTPGLLVAACDVLVTAVECHPSLLDALLFPCGLEQALLEKENTSGNAAPTQAADAKSSSNNWGKPPGGKKAGAAPPRSCLDALWEVLQLRERLQAEQPAVLAKLLQVLSAFWQSSGAAFRAVAVLHRQPGLWGHISGLLEAGGKAGPLALPYPLGSSGGGSGGERGDLGASVAASWVAQEPAAVLLSAEAYALQIAAAECYTWAAGSTSCAPGGMPGELAAFLQRLPADLVPQLLQRYASPLPTQALVLGAQRAAAAAGLQLLGAALSDEVLWRSMGEGSALAPQLAHAAQLLLRQFSSQGAAARALAERASQLAARSFPAQPASLAVAQLVMQQAELPERVAADREFGKGFAYDAQLYARRLGGVLVQQLDALRGLTAFLEGASVAASLEDARLAAITGLKALLSVAHKQRSTNSSGGTDGSKSSSADLGGKVPAAAVQSALGVLCDALRDIVACARQRADRAAAAAAEMAVVDPLGAHLCSAAEAAHVLLLLAQRWAAAAAAGGPDGEAAAVALCTGVLQAAGEWLEAWEEEHAASLSPHPDAASASASITGSLLAAALLLLPLAPAATEVTRLPSLELQRLEAAATRLLPLLLAACHREPPHPVLVVSLAAALIERQVPSAAWLPMVHSHLHFGNLLHSMLASLHSAAQQAQQAVQHRAGAASRAHQPATQQQPAALPGTGPAALAAATAAATHEQQQAGLGPLAAASVEEAALLLALQVAQARGGAELLIDQGAVAHTVALGKWLLAPVGGNLMGETPLTGHLVEKGGAAAGAKSAPAGSGVIDYSNAYLQDGSPNPAHRLWCCVLSLLALLLAALPRHAAVEEAVLRLAVEAEPRLLLAAEPPAASPQQPLTLAMAQETKYTLFFLCGLARLSGQWRLLLPDSLPAFRRATASFLDWVASPGRESISCAPISPAEKAVARSDAAAASDDGNGGGAGGGLRLDKGWFGEAAAGSGLVAKDRRSAAAAPAGGYAWQLGERVYSSAQYALSFQLALAPEVGEEELSDLGPEWVHPTTLLPLQEGVLEVADACVQDGGRAAQRLGRCLQALLGLSSEMQDGMGAERPHRHKQAVAKMIERLATAAAPGGGRS